MNQAEKDNLELQNLLDRYSDMLFKIAYMRLQNVQDAEDVVQETFFQYCRRKGDFETDEHEKAWLIKVTLNGCRKMFRGAWRRRVGNEEEEEALSKMDQEEGDRGIEGLEEEIVRLEQSRAVLGAVKSLPAKYRDVIHLFYYEEMTVREIAEATGRKESTVTSQLTRGRALLRKKLKEEYDFA